MRDHISLERGSLTLETKSVGPRHDPYFRTTVERHQGGRLLFRLTSCALAGDTLETWTDDGGQFVQRASLSTHGEDREQIDAYRAEVERLTGHDPRFWLERVWAMRDAHKSAEWHEMRDIDARMLSYAM